MKGAPAKPENFRVASIALGVAAGLKAPYKAQVALMEALIVESQVSNITFGDRDSIGVLQLRAFWSSSVNRMDVAAVVKMFLTKGFWGKGGAIALANSGKYPSGVVAQKVQGSGVPQAYAQFQQEAIAWVRAYGGGGGAAADAGGGSESADLTVKRAKRYAFKRGGSAETENTWQAGLRLTAEVGWRFFVVQNVLFIVAEEDLFDSRPRIVVNRDSDGVDDIDFSIVMGRKDPKKPDPTKNPSIAEMTIPCRIDRWQAPPGTIAEVEEMGPADGKWLVTTRSRDLFSTQGTITLKKPIRELPEPAPEVVESKVSVSSPAESARKGSAQGGSSGPPGVKVGEAWGGAKSIFDQFIIPFMKRQGLGVSSLKRPNNSTGGKSDHWVQCLKCYAADFPTSSGRGAAQALGRALGISGPVYGTFARYNVNFGGVCFSVQILWEVEGHYDHVHVGARRCGYS